MQDLVANSDQEKIQKKNDLLSSIFLLPQEVNTLIADPKSEMHYLNVYKDMLEIGIEAFSKLLDSQFKFFDAQVGDTSCQIRAYKVFLISISYKRKELYDAKKLLERHLEKTKKIICFRAKNKDCSRYFNSSNIDSLLKNDGVAFEINKDYIFLVYCYFLKMFSILDKNGIPVQIDFKKVGLKLGVSKYFSKRIIHVFQKRLSLWSCEFIVKLTYSLPQEKLLYKTLLGLIRISDEGRYILPCFEITKIILKDIIDKGYPVLINFTNISTNNKNLVLYDPKTSTIIDIDVISGKSQPFLLIKTKTILDNKNSCFIKKLLKFGFCKLIYSINTMHPQYSGGVGYL